MYTKSFIFCSCMYMLDSNLVRFILQNVCSIVYNLTLAKWWLRLRDILIYQKDIVDALPRMHIFQNLCFFVFYIQFCFTRFTWIFSCSKFFLKESLNFSSVIFFVSEVHIFVYFFSDVYHAVEFNFIEWTYSTNDCACIFLIAIYINRVSIRADL